MYGMQRYGIKAKVICIQYIYVKLYFVSGDKKYNVVYPKGRKRWIVKKLLEGKDYSHLDALMDDVITLRQTPSRLDIHTFALPDTIPKNIAQSE